MEVRPDILYRVALTRWLVRVAWLRVEAFVSFTRFEAIAQSPCGRFEEQLRERHDAEMQRLQAEEEKVMDVEREAQETRLKAKQVKGGGGETVTVKCKRAGGLVVGDSQGRRLVAVGLKEKNEESTA